MGIAKSKVKSLAGKVFSGIAVFTFAFFASYLSSSHFSPVTPSEAASSTYYANISSAGSIDITLQSTPDGVYKVGKDSLTIDTNSTIGYKLYISTIDHSSDNNDNNGTSLSSGIPPNGLIDSATGAYISPSSGTVDTPVRLQTNTWGYTVSRSSSSEASTSYVDSDAAPTETKGGKSVWRAVPEYGNEDIFYTNTNPQNISNSTGTSTNLVDVYYAVNASTALPSGTYSNTVVYTAIVDGGTDETGDSEASIAPINQEGLDAGQEVTIATSLYPGLNINNLGDITVTIGDNNCTNITPELTSIGSLNIKCEAPAQTTYGKYTATVNIPKYSKDEATYVLTDAYEYIGYMQDFTCSNLAKGDSTLLADRRDHNIYTVKKMADDKCWMVNNLRFQQTGTLSSSTSNVPSNNTFALGDSTPAFGTSCVNVSNWLDTGNSSYGTYYNWYAVTAGSGTCSTTGIAQYDICPANWRLPTGGPSGEFNTLYTQTGSSYDNMVGATDDADGWNGVLSGLRNGSITFLQGTNGVYWSSTTNSTSRAYDLDLNGDYSAVNPQDFNVKYLGYSVRCLAK